MIKYCILGFGKIAKKHLEAIKENSEAELVAIVDPNILPKQVKTPVFQKWEDFLLAHIPCDVIVIATPNGLHFEQAKNAIEAGYHVLVEKPLTLSLAESETLIELAKLHKRRLFNVLQLRFSPVVQWIKSLIAQDEIGEVFMVSINCFWNRNNEYYQNAKWHGTKNLDGGVLFTQFSHFIDILNYWFQGDIEFLGARAANYKHLGITEFPDSGQINFRIEERGMGNMMYSTAATNKNLESFITIIAEHCSLKIGNQYLNQLNYFESNNIEIPNFPEDRKDFHHEVYFEIQEAINNGRFSLLDADQALPALDLIEKAALRFVEVG